MIHNKQFDIIYTEQLRELLISLKSLNKGDTEYCSLNFDNASSPLNGTFILITAAMMSMSVSQDVAGRNVFYNSFKAFIRSLPGRLLALKGKDTSFFEIRFYTPDKSINDDFILMTKPEAIKVLDHPTFPVKSKYTIFNNKRIHFR